jgi:hypothetical protein
MILQLLKGNPYGRTGDEEALHKAFEEGKADQRAADQLEVDKLTSKQQQVVEAFVDHVKQLEGENKRLKG